MGGNSTVLGDRVRPRLTSVSLKYVLRATMLGIKSLALMDDMISISLVHTSTRSLFTSIAKIQPAFRSPPPRASPSIHPTQSFNPSSLPLPRFLFPSFHTPAPLSPSTERNRRSYARRRRWWLDV